MALQFLSKKGLDLAAHIYKKELGRNLAKVGLRAEDLFMSDDPHVKEALELSPPEVPTGRMRRINRAIDLGSKQKNFMHYAPDVDQETWKSEITDMIERLEARDAEYVIMNTHKK